MQSGPQHLLPFAESLVSGSYTALEPHLFQRCVTHETIRIGQSVQYGHHDVPPRAMILLTLDSIGIFEQWRSLNVRFRPGADIASVNVLSMPPHLGACRAYLEDVTAAEFCE